MERGPFGGKAVGVAPVDGEPGPVAAGVALPDRDQAMVAGRDVDENAAAEVVGRVENRVVGADRHVVVPWRKGGDRQLAAAPVAGGVKENEVPLEAAQRRAEALVPSKDYKGRSGEAISPLTLPRSDATRR